jgi:DNA-binding MarR family transcriptional regulator
MSNEIFGTVGSEGEQRPFGAERAGATKAAAIASDGADAARTTASVEIAVGADAGGSVAPAAAAAPAPAASAVPAGDSLQALAAAAASFADTFHRWSSRRAIAAGANVTRLRLLHLVRCHGPQKMADLAESLDVTPRSVTALVDGLAHEGLVARVPHPSDRRVTLVELTCNGDLVQAQMVAYQTSLESLFVDMSEPDRETLLRLLLRLRNQMQAESAGGSAHRQEVNHA